MFIQYSILHWSSLDGSSALFWLVLGYVVYVMNLILCTLIYTCVPREHHIPPDPPYCVLPYCGVLPNTGQHLHHMSDSSYSLPDSLHTWLFCETTNISVMYTGHYFLSHSKLILEEWKCYLWAVRMAMTCCELCFVSLHVSDVFTYM